ncbi:MAG TPA: hypothetical protein VIJ34_16325 [Acidimicrobiales bacterium]
MALTLPEIENLRRSVAMLPAESPTGLNRAKALDVLVELATVTAERDRLVAELSALASLEEMLTQRHLAREPRSPEP